MLNSLKKPFNCEDFRAPGTGVYLDHSASTPIHRGLTETVGKILQAWGNPSSIHQAGRGPKSILREARSAVAKMIGVKPLELIFMSGGSEANNTVFHSVFMANKNTGRNKYLVSSVEHPSVVAKARELQALGAQVEWIPVSREGFIDLEFIEKHLDENTALVSVMCANNEFGSIFPIKKIAAMAHGVGAKMHSDCVQAFGKLQIDLNKLDVDYASISAHKFYSLKGCGVLYCKTGSPFSSLIHGGGQERYRRGGTENPLAIAALGYMAQYADKISEMHGQVKELRDYFEQEVQSRIPDIQITAKDSKRLPANSSLIIPGIDGETLLMNLDIEGFYVSTGAACSSGNPEPSPVLRAIGLSLEEAQSSLRVSFGWGNNLRDVEMFLQCLEKVVARIRQIRQEYA